MLILSRRVEQEIVFPHLDITVSVLQVRGRIVKVGVVAPKHVKVLRSECLGDNHDSDERLLSHESFETDDVRSDEAVHRRRNELNLLQLRLDAIQSRIDRGEFIDAESMLIEFSRTASLRLGDSTSAIVPDRTSFGKRAIRLLVVEDCDNERTLMAHVLAVHGFIVQVARDGNEAIFQLCHGGLPDVVLMDMQMPLADGRETISRLRGDHRFSQLKVYAVTGVRPPPFEEQADAGWDAWFTKPLDVACLVKRIREDICFAETQSTPSQ